VAAPAAALVALAVALLAWRARALTPGGAAAATVVGTLVLAGTGWAGGAVLAAFFVSSSAVGRVAAGRVAPDPDAKGERRDAGQVVANGGAAALAAAFAPWLPPSLGFWIVTASLAAAAADTWATSLGRLSRRPPRRLLLGAVVEPGANGGMTALGTASAAVGALVVAATGAAAARSPALAAAGTLVGFAGRAIDSLLGAVWQGRFRCPACAAETEWRRHRCGTRTVPTGGLAWLDNDGVNLAATSLAAGLGAVAWRLWSG
jgi:uncharacterized protein (TIGR00297 family)